MMPTRDPKELQAVGKRLRKARKALGLSQKELYDSLGVGASTWHNWESGKRLPDPLVMAQLRKVYGVTLDWVFAGETAGISRSLEQKMREGAG